jgi:TRAP-type C4-dicarboxylate transport system substrate-binding protein
MKKKSFLICLFAVILLSVIVIGGCSQPQTTPSAPSTEGQAETKEPAKTGQPVVELNFATWHHPTYPLNTGIWEPLIKDIEEKTEGRVKIYFHPGSVLVKGDETYDAVKTGTIDMGFTLQSYTTGVFPLTSILEFPFLFTSSKQVCLTAAELLKTNEAFQKEYGEVIPIWVGATDTSCMIATKRVNKVEDFKGLRIRTPGVIQNDVCNVLEIVPVSMPYAEVYDAIQRGVVDGTFGPQCSILEHNFHEVAKELLQFELYVTPLFVSMNKNSWNKISPEDQAAIQELLDQLPEKIGNQYDTRLEADKKIWEENGLIMYSLPEEEMQKIHTMLEPLIDKWLSDMEAKGIPARDVYEEIKRLAEKYKQ